MNVSVVVPVRNAERTIAPCVESLLALDYPDVEVVVVDNGSTDRTRELLAPYPVRVVEEAAPGPAAARNAGVRAAAHDVIVFTDADCTVDPRWLAELVPPLADADVGIAGGAIRARPGATRRELRAEARHDQRAAIEVWQPPYVITMSWASRREVLEESGLFDERLRRGEDGDLSYRIGSAGYRLVYRPAAVVYHHGDPQSLLGTVREGWLHGFYRIPVVLRHADYVRRSATRVVPAPKRAPDRAFELGKRWGERTARLWLRIGERFV
jgi:glycosyltransferase involved in cell wall biosynthesis